MRVVKRDKSVVPFDRSRIAARLDAACEGLATDFIDRESIVDEVCKGLYSGVATSRIDQHLADTITTRLGAHPDHGLAGGRVMVFKLHEETESDLLTLYRQMRQYIHPTTGAPAALINDEVMAVMEEHHEYLQTVIDYTRSYQFDYFGFATLMRSYLLKMNNRVAERPQQMYMRVAIGIHGHDIPAVVETYEYLSRGLFTHATPTLFNAGTCQQQMSSCYLLTMKDDSIGGIYETLARCAEISKHAGGIGLSVHTIRGTGSYVRGTNGTSNGIVPMLKVFNETANYVDQGGGRRKGAFAIYLEPHHRDVFDFLDCKKHDGAPDRRAFDLFYAMWISDLFMERIENDQSWSLFCPNEAPGLCDVYGDEYKALYESYEADETIPRETISARRLWKAIIAAQFLTGGPYILFKDAVNRKSNQKNIGVIRNSNLCTEIVQYTSPDEIAVCNLASVALNRFARPGDPFDFEGLEKAVRVLVRNLNRVIDRNFYPVPEARYSNRQHRPVGIGVQGLADVFYLYHVAFDSDKARQLNKHIFESMYYAAVDESCRLAERDGPYDTFAGSPLHEGKFQFDLWGAEPTLYSMEKWDELRGRVRRNGVRNSLLIALMPTASTAQILRNTESIEPNRYNIYTRRVLSGEFLVVNRYLVDCLIRRGLWSDDIQRQLRERQGSIQTIEAIPADIKAVYRTVWEIPQRTLIDMSADRGPFVCQTQSLNLYKEEPDNTKLHYMYYYAWRKGLKTGQYYLRMRPKAQVMDTESMARAAATTEPREDSATPAEGATGPGNPKIDLRAQLQGAPSCLNCGS